MKPSHVLTLPGWQGSGPEHWLSRWERRYGYTRVEQHDWQRPLRGDWMVRLQDMVLACDGPVVLVAHSLGCLQLAWWAAHSRDTGRVKAALLVAPPDLAREDLRPLLPGWLPVARQRLPFPSLLLASTNDPYSDVAQARALAADWGSELRVLGAQGHLNAESGLGDWPEGHALLQELMKE